MLNYNLNINSPLQQEKKNEDVRPPIYWDFHSFASASDSTDLSERTFATMSITAPSTNCIQVSVDSGNEFVTDAQYPVTASVTGSNWPITGSTTMSLFTAGITYDPASVDQYYFAAISASALDIFNNPSITGSIIKNEFSASEFYRWYVSGSILHMKGNVYNGPINWLARNQSPSTTTGNVNGFTSSFNIVKDRNVRLVNLQEVTGSTSSSFNNFYALNITSSLTASIINNATGSTTMSISIPEVGISTSSLLFNPSSAGVQIITASFTASQNEPYNITASVIFNKGNINNGPINFLSTNLSPISNVATLNGYTASFNLVKDKNVSIINYPQVTGSRFGTFNNDYAFNFTSSLTASIQSNATGSVTMSLEIPEAGIITSSKIFSATSAGVNIITASFDTRNEEPYNITASVIFNKGNLSTASINWNNIAKSDSQDLENDGTFINNNSSSFNIVKDRNVSVIAIPYASQSNSGTFSNDYAFNITSSLTASILANTTGSVTMSLEIPEIGFSTSSKFFNPISTGIKILSASFAAQTNSSSYNITASVINNKGNIHNPLVKVLATGSNSIYSNSQGTNTILNIVKNVNEPISMSIGNITGSQTTEFQYLYAFNITSSLTGSANWPRSASHLYPTMSLLIPEAGINVISYQTASIITASFAASQNEPYNITASIAPRYIPAFSASFYLFGGGGGGAAGTSQPGGGGGAGAMFTGSFNIAPNRTYSVIVGSGGASDTAGDTTQFNGFDMGVVENIPITMSLQGGRNGSGMNGGNSGTGSYTIGTTTTQLPLFTGGSGDDGSGGGILRFAAGGGAGSSQNGVSGIASPNRVSGNGGNGFVALGGGGGGGGADKRNFIGATRGDGGNAGGGDGGGTDTNQNGFPATAFGAGGGGATSTNTGVSGGTGFQGVLLLSYPGTGSRFTATGNYTLSYDSGTTTYTFNPGSSSFSYVYEPELNPAPLT